MASIIYDVQLAAFLTSLRSLQRSSRVHAHVIDHATYHIRLFVCVHSTCVIRTYSLAKGASNMLANAPPVDELLRNVAAAGAANTAPDFNLGPNGMPVVDPRNSFKGINMAGPPTRVVPGADDHVHRVRIHTDAAAVSSTFQYGLKANVEGGHAPSASDTDGEAPASTSEASHATHTANNAVPIRRSSSRDNLLNNGNGNNATPAASAGSDASIDEQVQASSASAHVAAPPAKEGATIGLKPRMRDLPLKPGQTVPATTSAAPATSSSGSGDEEVMPVDPESSSAVGSMDDVKPPPKRGNVNLSGIWVKDLEKSELANYEKCIDMWGLSGVQKQTAKLLEGLEVSHKGDKFDVHFLTIIPYFKVTETYTVNGKTKNRRRDLRHGDAVSVTKPIDGGVFIETSFGDSFPGNVEETYWSPEPDVLHVRSTIFVGDRAKGAQRSASTLQIYHKKNMSKSEFLKQSEKRNGNANDIIKQFGRPPGW